MLLRHPVVSRAASSFMLCGASDVTSQLFLSSPARVDAERAVRFSSAGALSVIPVWFGWNQLLGSPVLDAKSLLRRIAVEAFLLGPLYLSSLLWWSATIKSGDVMNGFSAVKNSAFSLYCDALKVVPVYNAVTYFAVAPHMRGYALTFSQFFWNVYVSWFVDDACKRFPENGGRPSTGMMLELIVPTPAVSNST